MAITTGNTQTQALTTTTASAAFDRGTDSDCVLVIGVHHGTLGSTITAATYGGVNLTAITTGCTNASANDYIVDLYYIASPASGSNTLSVTVSSGTVGWQVIALNGADTTTVPDSSSSCVQATGTQLTTSTTCVLGTNYLVGIGRHAAGATQTMGVGTQVSILNLVQLGRSTSTVGSGSQSIRFDTNSSSEGFGIVASFAEAGLGTTQNSNFLSFLM